MNPIVLPLAASMLFLYAGNSEPYPYSFSVGAVNEGSPCPLRFSYLKSRYPEAYICVDATCGSTRHRVIDAFPLDLPVDAQGFCHYSYVIPKSVFTEGRSFNLVFGLTREAYRNGLDIGRFYVRFSHDRKVGPASTVHVLNGDDVVILDHETYYFDPKESTTKVLVEHDAFIVYGTPQEWESSSRKVPLSRIELDYMSIHGAPPSTPRAELRVLNYKDDYEGIGTDEGNFLSIPLSSSIRERGKGDYVYSFGLESRLFYSLVDLGASTGLPAEPSLASRELYVPLRRGRDATKRNYQLRIRNFGAHGDELVIPFSFYPGAGFFGPCDGSTWCVVGR